MGLINRKQPMKKKQHISSIDPIWRDWTIGGRYFRLGYQDQIIGREECPYLRRRILHIGFWSVRYHVFYRSDEERALHDHPWAFWTFPLSPYDEHYIDKWHEEAYREVKRFRLYLRRHGFTHRVVTHEGQPARTLIFTHRKKSTWGFYDKTRGFMHWREWLGVMGLPPCADFGSKSREERKVWHDHK